MEVAFGDTGLFGVISLVVGVGVESLVRDNVILQQGLQIFLSVTTEQEAINPGAKFLEGEIRRRKYGTTNVIGRIIHRWDQVGLRQS